MNKKEKEDIDKMEDEIRLLNIKIGELTLDLKECMQREAVRKGYCY